MARHPPHSKNALPEAASEPQAEQEETAAFYQCTLAVETASGAVPLSALPGQRLRGRRHQGSHPGKKALGSKLFSAGSRQTVVLRGIGQAGSCSNQTGLRNQSVAGSVGLEENEQEAG